MKRALVLPALLLVAACGGSSSGLADRDPNGARACDALSTAFESKDDQDKAINGVVEAGKAADLSSTPSIKSTVVDIFGTKGADAAKLRAACVAEGVEMAEMPS